MNKGRRAWGDGGFPVLPQRPLPQQLRSPEPVLVPAGRQQAVVAVADDLSAGNSVRRLLAFGPPGVGKSTVLRSIARRMHDNGANVIFCGHHRTAIDVERPYSSLLDAVPELQPHLVTMGLPGLPEDPERPGARTVARWYRVGEAIAALDPGRTLALVIDDAPFLDRHTSALIEFIGSATACRRVALVMSADDADQLTVPLRRSLLRPDARYLMLGPMEIHDVNQLVIERFRDSTAPVRRTLAADLMRRSDGLPAVIEALLPMVNRATFTIEDPDVPGPDAVEASIASAGRFAVEGSYREAVEHLTALSRVEGLRLTAETRTLLAFCLYRMGALAEADRVRVGLVEEALMADDHRAALAAARIGLPDAETIDGDEERLNGFLGIHHERLPKDQRLSHAIATAREAMHCGRIDLAFYWAQQADGLATDWDQRAAVAHLAWHLGALTERPEQRRRPIDSILDARRISPMWRALLHELRAIDHYEMGKLAEAAADYEVLGSYADQAEDGLRKWHQLMFQTTVLMDAGNWQRAEEVRTEAMTLAMQHGILGGEGLYVAQHYHSAWICNTHGDLVDMFPDIPPEIGKTGFGQAGLTETLRAAGRLDEAIEVGRPLVERVLSGQCYSWLGLMAFLARFIAETGSRETVDRAVDILLPRAGTAVLMGAGIASMGPADRYLYQLTGQVAHLDRAIAFADRAEYRLWQVLLRVEHPDYSVDGAGMLTRQARNLAEGTDLVQLLSPTITAP